MRRVDEPRVASGSVGHWLLECRTQERSVRRVLSTVQNWTRSMGCDVMFVSVPFPIFSNGIADHLSHIFFFLFSSICILLD